MENEIRLYEDEYFYITNCKEFPKVPGLVAIYSKIDYWYCSKNSIKKLALIEKTIREELMNQGFELAGIYREEYKKNKFRILIIPYDVKILEKNNISPDMYQPYIRKYLESFEDTAVSTNDVNVKVLKKLKQGVDLNGN